MFVTEDGEKSLVEFLEMPDADNSVFFKLNPRRTESSLIVKDDRQDGNNAAPDLIPSKTGVTTDPRPSSRQGVNVRKSTVKSLAIIGGIACLLLIISRRG